MNNINISLLYKILQYPAIFEACTGVHIFNLKQPTPVALQCICFSSKLKPISTWLCCNLPKLCINFHLHSFIMNIQNSLSCKLTIKGNTHTLIAHYKRLTPFPWEITYCNSCDYYSFIFRQFSRTDSKTYRNDAWFHVYGLETVFQKFLLRFWHYTFAMILMTTGGR